MSFIKFNKSVEDTKVFYCCAAEDAEVDHCFSQPCRNGGICYKLPGSYYCDCPTRYNGLHCEIDSGIMSTKSLTLIYLQL